MVFMLLLACLFSIAAFSCMLDRRPFISMLMSFTAVSIVASVAMAVG